MSIVDEHTSALSSDLRARYGHFLTADEVVDVLRLASVDALRMARGRGRIRLEPLREGRKRVVFTTDSVAAALATMLAQAKQERDAM